MDCAPTCMEIAIMFCVSQGPCSIGHAAVGKGTTSGLEEAVWLGVYTIHVQAGEGRAGRRRGRCLSLIGRGRKP